MKESNQTVLLDNEQQSDVLDASLDCQLHKDAQDSAHDRRNKKLNIDTYQAIEDRDVEILLDIATEPVLCWLDAANIRDFL